MKSLRPLPLSAIVLILAAPASTGAPISLSLQNVVWVSSAGTDTERCQSLLAAIAWVQSNVATSEQVVIKVPAGRYDCGATPVAVAGNMTLEGSGAHSTTIAGTRDLSDGGVVHLNSGAGLARLKVDNTNPSPTSGGIAVSANAPAGQESKLTDVWLSAAEMDPNRYSLYAIVAKLRVDRSRVEDTVALGFVAEAVITMSELDSVQLSGSATAACRYTVDLGSGTPSIAGCP